MPHVTLNVKSQHRDQMIDLTAQVQAVVADAGVLEGSAVVFVPHTTAGITLNENADPDVVHDLLHQLDAMVPWKQSFYRHAEGNSASHIKATLTGSSVTVLVAGGKLVLGTWQGVWFCEFDGPRSRKVFVAVRGEG